MKKYSFILCIALVAFVVASCGLKGNHTSSGRAYELLVVVDHGVWDRAAGRALHDALDADMPGLPQSEPSFRLFADVFITEAGRNEIRIQTIFQHIIR